MKKLITLFSALAFSWSVAQAQDPTIYNDYGKIINNFEYDKLYNKDHKLDLYLAKYANPTAPFAILIHGGGYTGGSKADMQYLAETLMMDNISSVVIDYSVMSNLNVKEFNAPTYNTMLLDIWHAIKYVQTRSIDWNVRPDNYILIGEEAGGHLAMLAGYKFYNNISKIIAISSPTDLKDLRDVRGMTPSYNKTKALYSKLLGNVPYTNEHNVPYEYLNASPIYQIKNVPTLLIHGDNDNKVPNIHSVRMYEALKAKNVPVKYVNIDFAGSQMLKDEYTFEDVYGSIISWINE